MEEWEGTRVGSCHQKYENKCFHFFFSKQLKEASLCTKKMHADPVYGQTNLFTVNNVVI